MNECGDLYGGLSGKSSNDFGAGEARYVPYVNVFKNAAVDLEALLPVSVEAGERQNAIALGDVLFTGSSESRDEVGMTSVVLHEPGPRVFLNSFCIGYRWAAPGMIHPGFAKHLFRSRDVRRQITRTAQGVTRFNVSRGQLGKVRIPVVALGAQQRIAEALDSMEALTISLTEGLPAEIAARRKQYEYYRDKLLTFEEAPA